MKCPCASAKDYAVCCEPIIQQKQKAATAEQLMRSRYSAYALGHIDWIIDSQSPDGRQFVDRAATEAWSKRAIILPITRPLHEQAAPFILHQPIRFRPPPIILV